MRLSEQLATLAVKHGVRLLRRAQEVADRNFEHLRRFCGEFAEIFEWPSSSEERDDGKGGERLGGGGGRSSAASSGENVCAFAAPLTMLIASPLLRGQESLRPLVIVD